MVEYIDRGAVLQKVKKLQETEPAVIGQKLFADGYFLGLDELEVILRGVPTVDPVHAAGACYCGECKHWQKAHSSLIGEVMCCTGQGSVRIQKAADDFCSSGERRKDA